MNSKKNGCGWRAFTLAWQTVIILTTSAAIIELGAWFWLVKMAEPAEFLRFASYRQIYDRMQQTGTPLTRHLPHRYLGHIPSPNYRNGDNYQNELGFRGELFPVEKPEGEYRIFCMGGSTTYTNMFDDYRQSYPNLLEKELHEAGYGHVRVINAGVPGYGSTESLINLELRVLDYDPDMIIVLHAVNDMVNRLVWPPDAVRGDNSASMGWSPGFFQPAPFLEKSNAIRIFLIASGRTQSHAGLLRCFVTFPETCQWIKLVNQFSVGEYPSGIFKEVPAMQIVRTNPPVYFKRNMENIVYIAKSRDIQPVLLTMPLCQQMTHDFVTVDAMITGVGQHNQVTRGIGRDLETPVCDLAATFPLNPQYFKDSVHVNESGSALKAKMVAEFLVENSLIPPVAKAP